MAVTQQRRVICELPHSAFGPTCTLQLAVYWAGIGYGPVDVPSLSTAAIIARGWRRILTGRAPTFILTVKSADGGIEQYQRTLP